jgi:hypothetical protein
MAKLPIKKDPLQDRKARMLAKARELKSKRSGDLFNCPDGETKFRILPPFEVGGDWYYETGWHYGLGPDRTSCVCHDVTFGKRCPVCEKMNEFLKNGDENEKKVAKQMRPRTRVFANVWISDSPDEVRGNKVLAFGAGVFQDLLSYFTDGDYSDPDDLDKGYFVKVKRSGTGFDTEYEVKLVPKSQRLSDFVDDVDEILAKRKPLETVIEVLGIDEIEELVESTDFDNYTTKPAARGSKDKPLPKKKRED